MAIEVGVRPSCATCGGEIEWRIHSLPPYLGYWAHSFGPAGDGHTPRPATCTRTQPKFQIGAHVRVLGETNHCGTVASVFESIRGNWAYGVLYDDHQLDYPVGQSGYSYSERELEALEL